MRASGRFAARQRGVVLLVGLIMLLMVTLMAISGFNMVKVNQQVAGNMESRAQAAVVANAAIEEAISGTLFFQRPENVFINSCGSANRKCYDLNADGVTDVTVSVSRPGCVVVLPKPNSYFLEKAEALKEQAVQKLAANLPVEANELLVKARGLESCTVGGGHVGMSRCADVTWDLEAVAVDEVTGARATVRQGVAVTADINNVASACRS
ncbi:hypothetical protein D3C85_856490 [compost metagenome]